MPVIAGAQNWLHMFWYARAHATSGETSRSQISVRTSGGVMGPPMETSTRDDSPCIVARPAVNDAGIVSTGRARAIRM